MCSVGFAENETQQDNVVGDMGRAFGVLQEHPEFFAQWYVPVVGDTWEVAQIRAALRMFKHYCTPGVLRAVRRMYSATAPVVALSIEDCVMVFHLGYTAFVRGAKDEEYRLRWRGWAEKFSVDLTKTKYKLYRRLTVV